MDRLALEESESRFAAFIGSLNDVIGHCDRIGPFRDYCAGLLAGCERKSVEPLAAITAPSRVSAQHQSLLHFVGNAPWSDAAVLSKVRELTLPVLEKHGPVEAFNSMTRVFRRKASTPSGSRGNIAANPASRTIARSPFRCRLRTIMRAFPSPTAFICPRNGPTIRKGAQKREFPATPRFRPSLRSRWRKSLKPCKKAFRELRF